VTLRSRFRRLRSQTVLKAFSRAIAAANARHAERFRVAHYSLQRDHVHLIVEAECEVALSRGMQGLAVRLAHRINRVLGRRGTFWADRFHSRELETPGEVRRVLVYVLANYRKHEPALRVGIDPYSSGVWFAGFREPGPLPFATGISERTLDLEQAPVTAQTWLLKRGWLQAGRISVRDAPSAALQTDRGARRQEPAGARGGDRDQRGDRVT
jgi:REP element-mobilizing transposase RayT